MYVERRRQGVNNGDWTDSVILCRESYDDGSYDNHGIKAVTIRDDKG